MIKFKAKTFEDKWVYGHLVMLNEQSEIHGEDIYNCDDNAYQTAIVKADTLCKYTGYKDRNGIDIYANDIVISSQGGQRHKVVFSLLSDSFIGVNLSTGSIVNMNDDIEIVGNTYDNI